MSNRRMVCLLIAPTLESRHRYFFFISHLHKIAVLEQFIDLLLSQTQYVARCLLELLLLIGIGVRSVALRENPAGTPSEKMIVRYHPISLSSRAIVCLTTPPPRPASPDLCCCEPKGSAVATLEP